MRTLTLDGGGVVRAGDAPPIEWTAEHRVVVRLERGEAGAAPGGMLDITTSPAVVSGRSNASPRGGSGHAAGRAHERHCGRAAPMWGAQFRGAADEDARGSGPPAPGAKVPQAPCQETRDKRPPPAPRVTRRHPQTLTRVQEEPRGREGGLARNPGCGEHRPSPPTWPRPPGPLLRRDRRMPDPSPPLVRGPQNPQSPPRGGRSG